MPNIKETVDRAFAQLDRLTESNHSASLLLANALREAEDGERRHRRMGRGMGGYRGSVRTAARYFVCKWFLEPAKVSSALSACSLRLDCLYASAVREWADAEGKTVNLAGIADIDYSRDLVSA